MNHGCSCLLRYGGLIALVLMCVAGAYVWSVTADESAAKPLVAAMRAADQPLQPAFQDNQEQFLLWFLWAVLAVIIAGAVGLLLLLLLLLTIGLVAGLIAAGVVSASVVIGVLRRSVSTGFRALFFQIGGVLGLMLGALGALLFILVAKLPMNSVQPWVIGPVVGVVFGLLAAWMFNFAWGRSVEWIARRLPGKKVVEVEGERVVSGDS